MREKKEIFSLFSWLLLWVASNYLVLQKFVIVPLQVLGRFWWSVFGSMDFMGWRWRATNAGGFLV